MNSVYFYIFAFIATILATFLGSIIPFILKNRYKKITSFLTTFSTGLIMALLFIELIPESIENSMASFQESIFGVLLSLGVILITFILFFALHELVHRLSKHHQHDQNDKETCHDHLHSEEFLHNNSKLVSSFIFLFAILIHNIPEGFVLGTFFNNEGFPLSGLLMTISLFFHNITIGYSIGNSFKEANKKIIYTTSLATLNGLVSFILGIIGFYLSLSLSSLVNGIIFSIASGSLLFILLIELLPELFYERKNRYSILILLLGFIVGSCLILL